MNQASRSEPGRSAGGTPVDRRWKSTTQTAARMRSPVSASMDGRCGPRPSGQAVAARAPPSCGFSVTERDATYPPGRRAMVPADVSPARTREPVGEGRYRSLRSAPRSEEHTSELQSRQYLVCRLLLEKKK